MLKFIRKLILTQLTEGRNVEECSLFSRVRRPAIFYYNVNWIKKLMKYSSSSSCTLISIMKFGSGTIFSVLSEWQKILEVEQGTLKSSRLWLQLMNLIICEWRWRKKFINNFKSWFWNTEKQRLNWCNFSMKAFMQKPYVVAAFFFSHHFTIRRN